MHDIVTESRKVRGFIQSEFFDQQQADFLPEAERWIYQCKLKWREDIVKGLKHTPQEFIGLLEGRNFGKLIVRLV
jgi:NADPH-dependent curcumin reductase